MKAIKFLLLVMIGSSLVACGNDHFEEGFDIKSWSGMGITPSEINGVTYEWEPILNCRYKQTKNLHVYYQVYRSPESQDVVRSENGKTITEYGFAMVAISAVYKNINGGGMRNISYRSADIIKVEGNGEKALAIKQNEYLYNDLEAVNKLTFKIPEYNNGNESQPLSFDPLFLKQDDPMMLFAVDRKGTTRNLSKALLPGFEPITSIVITEKGNNFDSKIKMECK